MCEVFKNNKLPEEQLEILKECVEFFKSIGIDYWLAGGLFQLIKQKKYKEIKKAWKKREHDIDFHIKLEDKEIIKTNFKKLKDKGFFGDGKDDGDYGYKLAFKRNGHSVEFICLHKSPNDERNMYFLGYGKKEVFEKIKLSNKEKLRQRSYRYDLPKEAFVSKRLTIDGLEIKVPEEMYIKILYPDFS